MTDVTPVNFFARPMPTGGGLRNQAPDLAGEIRQEIRSEVEAVEADHYVRVFESEEACVALDAGVRVAVRRVTEAQGQNDELIAELERVQGVADYAKARIDKALALCEIWGYEGKGEKAIAAGSLAEKFRAVLSGVPETPEADHGE